MAGRGREVYQSKVLSDRPTGDPFASRSVEPHAREYLNQYAYLRGAGPLIALTPSIGLPAAGAVGPNWTNSTWSQTPPTPGADPADGGAGGCT